jgi:shikimate kinase
LFRYFRLFRHLFFWLGATTSVGTRNFQMKIESQKTQSAIRDPQSAIFLVGFMASGKSTVGPLLAARLKRLFIDLDNLIEANVNCTIAELIEREGEERFRRIETETLRDIARGEPAVIAPGGGAITRVENRELMNLTGTTIWLDAPFELCWRRIQEDITVRPLAPNKEIAQARYLQRLSLYRSSLIHILINYSQPPEEIAELIVRRLQ